MPPTQSIYSRIGRILGIFLGLFLLARLALLLIYYPSFAELGLADMLVSFVHGIRFDASITLTFIGIPLLLMALPHRWSTTLFWQGLLLWLIYLVLTAFVFMTISDLIYYGFVQRHAGPEITLITGDMALLLDMLLNQYRLGLILFIVAFIAGGILWYRQFNLKVSRPEKALPRYGVIALMFIMVIFIGRGGLQYKPIKVTDAFLGGSTAGGYLTVNGPFAMFHSIRGSQPINREFMPLATAVELVRKRITTTHERYIDNNYPLLRTSAAGQDHPSNKPNIVIFMLESWDAIHIDYFRRQKGLQPWSVTPNFDAMMQQGRLYTRFYAAGTRSMDGVAGILASVPTLPGMPYIGTGMDQNRLSYLAEFAKEQGYHTVFLQSSNRGSFRLDSVAAKAGFETYLGSEDIPPAHTDAPRKELWGVWDYSTFMEANRQFAKQSGPFLGFVFSSTTHNPWRVPDKRWQKFPEDSEHHRYLNSLYYADWALGQFMAEAKKQPYYDNTIFLITGDHVSGFDSSPQNLPSHYHLPLLITGPGIKPGIDDKIGSQLDIAPTILDITRWKTVHSSVGRSLFDESNRDSRAAFCINGTIIDYIQQNSWLSHNLQQRLDQSITDSGLSIDSLERDILATHQVVMKGMLENRIYHKPAPAMARLSP